MADMLGWRWEFGVQVVPLFILTSIAAVAVPHDLGLQGRKESVLVALRAFDYRGSILLTTAITFFVLGLVSGNQHLKVDMADLFVKEPWWKRSSLSVYQRRKPESSQLVTNTIQGLTPS